MLAFLVAAFAITWGLEGAVAAGGPEWLRLIGAGAPSLVALALTRRFPWRARPAFVAAAFLAPIAIVAATGAVVGMSLGAPWLVVAIGAPLGEELGWRGYLHPRATARWSWLGAGLFVGAAWALWHVPPGLMQGASVATTALFALRVTAFGVVIAWLTERGGGGVWIGMAAHAGVNLGIVRLAGGLSGEVATTVAFLLAAALTTRDKGLQARAPARASLAT